jgi:hypothetical protein
VNGQREPVTPMAVPCPQDGCGGSAEVFDRFSLWSTDGDILHVKIRCGVGHWFTLPFGPEPIQGDRVRVQAQEHMPQGREVRPYGHVSWVRNVRATPEVSLRRGRTTQALYPREVDADTAGPVLKRYVRQVKVTAPFFDAKVDDPTRAFVAEAHRHPVFELTPTHAAHSAAADGGHRHTMVRTTLPRA